MLLASLVLSGCVYYGPISERHLQPEFADWTKVSLDGQSPIWEDLFKRALSKGYWKTNGNLYFVATYEATKAEDSKAAVRMYAKQRLSQLLMGRQEGALYNIIKDKEVTFIRVESAEKSRITTNKEQKYFEGRAVCKIALPEEKNEK